MESSGKIYELMPKIMGEVGAVAKTRRNPQQGYQFRGIDDLYQAVQPVLAKNGVFIAPEVLEQLREERQTRNGGTLTYTILRVRHTFYAPDGSNVVTVTVGEAMDSGDKSANKSMSAAMKYALIETFCIPTEEGIDTEYETHEVAPRQNKSTREIVNENTGEVRPSEVAPDPLKDDAKFLALVDEAFEGGEFDTQSRDLVIGKVCGDAKVKNLAKLKLAWRGPLIDKIVNGGFDNLKVTNGQALAGAR